MDIDPNSKAFIALIDQLANLRPGEGMQIIRTKKGRWLIRSKTLGTEWYLQMADTFDEAYFLNPPPKDQEQEG